MKSCQDHLNEQLTNIEFKKLYGDEKYLLELGLQIAQARQHLSA
jgi:hypothetical protein